MNPPVTNEVQDTAHFDLLQKNFIFQSEEGMKKNLFLLTVLFTFGMSFIGCFINMTNPTANEFDVQIVGDSVFDLDAHVHKYLSVFSGKSYKDNSISGSQVSDIIAQYRKAIQSKPDIKTIIMDGGANDILQGFYWKKVCASSGSTVSSHCKSFINELRDQIDSLWDEMDTNGTSDIIHLGYYHLKNGFISGNGVVMSAAVDYADSITESACFASPANCYYVETRPSFNGNEASYIKLDGLHPTDAGGEVLAGLIWKQMVSANVYR